MGIIPDLRNFVVVRDRTTFFCFRRYIDFFSSLPLYHHGHRDCHHLPLILFSAGDVPAFVFVFCFFESGKNEEKEIEDTCDRLSNRLVDSDASLQTRKELEEEIRWRERINSG
jgi:hypothetical protein